MEKFDTLLDDLAKKIADEETLIRDNFVDNMRRIETDKSSYDLSPDSITSSEVDFERSLPDYAQRISVNYRQVEEITDTYMPAVESEINRISNNLYGCMTFMALSRDASIGIGISGPSRENSDFLNLLFELMRDLSWEVQYGGGNLKTSVQYMRDQDEDARRALDKMADNLTAGHPGDPWD